MPLDLTEDVRRCEGGKRHPARRIEAVDGLDESDRADLHEILDPLAAVRVAVSKRLDEREVRLDQALARGEVTPFAVRPCERRGRAA
jgi:hypothetical protein